MNALATIPAHGGRITEYNGAQLALIHRTVAKDTNPDEFNLFMRVARLKGLDPFTKQISAIVFSKNNAQKRQMSIIVTIDGMRSIAARSKRYRPDEDEPTYTYDEALKGPLNPLGIVKATVKIYVADHLGGAWRPVTGVAYWDEFAPVEAEWSEGEDGKRRPNGKEKLGGMWPRMGRVMIAKCAEAQALRKAFPEDLTGLYEGAELDRSAVIDLTATEVIERDAAENRLRMVGADGAILFQMSPTTALEPIKVGEVADRIIDALRGYDLAALDWFESVNRAPLLEFWARAKSDALGVKNAIAERRAALAKATQDAAQ